MADVEHGRGCNTSFGFGFLGDTRISISRSSWWAGAVGNTYARALLVCVLNTVLVRRSHRVGDAARTAGRDHAAVEELVGAQYRALLIEFVRNTPQLVQIIFWYVAILQKLPRPRRSIHCLRVLLNIRGLYLPG